MLESKVIMITGAASGIGRAAALMFAEDGASLYLADWNSEGAAETARLISDRGGAATATRLDVSDESGVEAFVAQILAADGRLDGAFNNAGVTGVSKLLEEFSAEEWRHVNDVNATGMFFCMKHQIRAMRLHGGGAIVNTSSANGVVAEPYAGGYVASKHAAVGITRAAAAEARFSGVRVNVILPGLILTPMVEGYFDSPEGSAYRAVAEELHSIGRFGQPEEVASVARFLLSDQASFVNGAAIPVDGGFTAR